MKDYQKDLVIPEALKEKFTGTLCPVSEVFQSFQGEGRNAGRNAVFVRFWGCNLACTWCDTPYSWQADKIDHQVKLPTDFIAELITTKFNTASVVIFTGGEPSLYEKQIRAIQDAIEEKGMYPLWEIETNGSKELTGNYDQINISPKLPSSGNKPYEIKAADEHTSFDFKFVIGSAEDIVEMEKIIEKHDARPHHVYLMPLGTTVEQQLESSKLIVPYALAKGYNLSIRQHIFLFGDTKGT